jgi:hypothetical protein
MTFVITPSDIFWAILCTLLLVGYLILCVLAKKNKL